MNAFAPASTASAGPELDNRRVLAAVIDLALIVAGSFVLGAIAGLVTGGDGGFTPQLRVIMVAWALYYYFALESGAGQTVGKRLMKLRVLRSDGSPAGMREIAIRTLLRVIDGLLVYLIGLIVMLVTGERRQRLGDLAAGTVVADASAEPADTAVEAAAAPAPPAPAEEAQADTAERESSEQPHVAETPEPDAPEYEPDAPDSAPAPPEQPAADEPAAAEPELAEPEAAEPEAAEPERAEPEAAETGASPEPDKPQDGDVSVRSVETVSAIDLVMGNDEARDEPADGADGRQQRDK